MTSTTVLSWITNFGDAGITIPVAAGCALWLSTTDKREALVWIGTLLGALVLVGVNNTTASKRAAYNLAMSLGRASARRARCGLARAYCIVVMTREGWRGLRRLLRMRTFR